MMAHTAEFIGGCYEGRHIIERPHLEYRAVKRGNILKFDDRPEIHVYRLGERQFSPELSAEQRQQIAAERGELVYVFHHSEPFVTTLK
jgi:hypothetical protein